MKFNIIGGLLVAALAITSVADAQTPAHPVKAKYRKEHKMEHRIAKGERSGKITPAQAQYLRREDRHIREEKRMALANGKMNQAERRHIHQQEKMLSRAIHRDKHNLSNNKVRG